MANSAEQTALNPRTTRVRRVVLDAAADLLVERGAREVTATRIAQESGVARTTIYRHWPDQSQLLLDTIDSVVAPHYRARITDDLEVDLTTALSDLRARMARNAFRQVFAALLELANAERAYIDAQRHFVTGVLQPIKSTLTAAIDRGDISRSLDTDQACAALAGPLFHQHVMLRERIDDRFIADTVDKFLASVPRKESV